MSKNVANDNQKSIQKTYKNEAETLHKSMKKTFEKISGIWSDFDVQNPSQIHPR
jgi:hypothetical protein